MITDHENEGALIPFNFDDITSQVPELIDFGFNLSTITFNPVIDSSNMSPNVWIELTKVIKENYENYDGFVILHGTDTMAFTASALSFMLENLCKPVIITGSQLPIGMIRTDGKENLITSIEIAAAKINGLPMVPEVCIYFESQLFRGNRTKKDSAENFNAFISPNYPALANAGINIKYNHSLIRNPIINFLVTHTELDDNIAILKLFPGLNKNVVSAILNAQGLKAVVLETYGAGNAITQEWFINLLAEAIKNNIIIFNVTQCTTGTVDMSKYETGIKLKKIGVIGGKDITTEAAVTKLSYLLGKNFSKKEVEKLLTISLRGEISN